MIYRRKKKRFSFKRVILIIVIIILIAEVFALELHILHQILLRVRKSVKYKGLLEDLVI